MGGVFLGRLSMCEIFSSMRVEWKGTERGKRQRQDNDYIKALADRTSSAPRGVGE